MASGASHADVAIMLVDARHGVKRQTRRHAAILDIVGVKRVILAVNKMDLVDWSQDEFRAIESRLPRADAALRLPRGDRHSGLRPLAATTSRAAREHMPWYTGPHLLEHLERSRRATSTRAGRSACPCRPCCATASTSAASPAPSPRASISVGDRVTDALSGQSAHVLRIATMDRDLEVATQGQAVALQLDTDIDVARGAMLSTPRARPASASQIEARLVWLGDDRFDPSAGYFLRTATDLAPISAIEIKSLLDLETLESPAVGRVRRQRHRHRPHHARTPYRARHLRQPPDTALS